MDKPNFTPGPWVAEPGAKRGAWVKGATGEWAALACGDTDESASANALMIAAAPDMHEALSGLLEQWKAFQASSGNMEEAYYKLAKYARPHWEKAAAALSKAEGGEGQGG